MVAPTEQNPDDVKVIAIKLPFDLQERLLAFPLLHALREQYREADIHFITPKKEIEVLNLLPFTAYYHEFDEDEISNVFDVHRYCTTVKIFNVDIFISLTNSFADACLGLGLRAKKRVGFGDGWKGMVLTHKIPRPRGHHLTEDFYALYGELIGAKPNTRLKVMSRDLTPVIPEWDSQPYIAINLSPIRNVNIEEEVADLINKFENQRIVLFSSEDQAKAQMVIDPFIAFLSRKNTYVNYVYKDWIELGKMLAFSKGCITFNGPAASLATYVGAKTVALYDSEDPQRFGPFYFLSDVCTLQGTDPNYAEVVKGALSQRPKFNMEAVAKKAFEFFRL